MLELVGQAAPERWAEAYHGLSRSKKGNPRQYVAESNRFAERFAQTGAQEDYDRAVAALFAYYRTFGAYRHPQVGMPAVLIRSNEGLRQRFAHHVGTVLKPSRRRYTRDSALAEYEMLKVANYVFDGKYRQEAKDAFARATPLIFTPFGLMYMGEEK